jgi:hypothetical protein
MMMFQGNNLTNAQHKQMKLYYSPSVPPRKRRYEDEPQEEEPPRTRTIQQEQVAKKRRIVVLPDGIGRSVPFNKKSWWRFGEIQRDLIKGLVEGGLMESCTLPGNATTASSKTAQKGSVTGAHNVSQPFVSTRPPIDVSCHFGPLGQAHAQARHGSAGFQSRSMLSKLSMSAVSSSTSASDDDDANSMDSSSLKFRAYQAENWTEKFEEMIEFRNQHGHCLVPNNFPDNPPLAQWVKRQRYQYKLKLEDKRSTMSDERTQVLEEVGFVWDSHSVIWEERFQELLEYKQATGHCNVPSRFAENRQLAVWVKRQRRQYKFMMDGKKPSSMTGERRASLVAIGFEWDMTNQRARHNDRKEEDREQVASQAYAAVPVVPL